MRSVPSANAGIMHHKLINHTAKILAFLKPSFPCIEVNLAISMYWSRGNNQLVQRPYGNENKAGTVITQPATKTVPVYDSGLVFTDGTVYAPQMPWYMSHYCFSAGPASRRIRFATTTTLPQSIRIQCHTGCNGNNLGLAEHKRLLVGVSKRIFPAGKGGQNRPKPLRAAGQEPAGGDADNVHTRSGGIRSLPDDQQRIYGPVSIKQLALFDCVQWL